MNHLPSTDYLLIQDEDGSCVLYCNAQRLQDYFGCASDALNFAWKHHEKNQKQKEKIIRKLAPLGYSVRLDDATGKGWRGYSPTGSFTSYISNVREEVIKECWAHYDEENKMKTVPKGYYITQDENGKVRCGEGYDFEDDEFDSEIYADMSLTWDEAVKACWADFNENNKETKMQSTVNFTVLPTTLKKGNKEFQLKVENDKEIVYKVKPKRFNSKNVYMGSMFYCTLSRCFCVIARTHLFNWNWVVVGKQEQSVQSNVGLDFKCYDDLIAYMNNQPSFIPVIVSSANYEGEESLTITTDMHTI